MRQVSVAFLFQMTTHGFSNIFNTCVSEKMFFYSYFGIFTFQL